MKKEIIITSIIGLSILGYGYLNYHYKTEVFRQSQREKLNNEVKLKECLSTVFEASDEQWQRNCVRLSRGKNCALPSDLAKYITGIKEKEEDNCIKMYSK